MRGKKLKNERRKERMNEKEKRKTKLNNGIK